MWKWKIVLSIGFATLLQLSSSSAPERVDTAPLDPVGSAVRLEPEITTICIQTSRELNRIWPVDQAIKQWNNNGKNLFTTRLDVDCDGIVIITESDTKFWWGSTEFYARNIINVQLSVSTPANRHLAVTCHELGHVLGLPHSEGDGSCMDPNQNNPQPTSKNITTVGKSPWSAVQAKSKIG